MNEITTAAGRTVTRRSLLTALVAAPALAGACSLVRFPSSSAGNGTGPDGLRRLPVPPLAPSRTDADGARLFELTAQAGTAELTPGRATRTWGFNGAVLGPTLRARDGEKVRVRVRNTLPEETTVHWHGMHLPAKSDGGPHQPIAPGATWTTEWTIRQDPATLWYHPHPHGATERHVYRGLSGFFLLDGDGPAGLPSEYGVDDIPVVIQDRRFTPAGQLDETLTEAVGMTGPTIITNGIAGAYLDAQRSRIRLRLLNGSSGRSYFLGLSDGRGFTLVGTDGGLLAAPVRMDRIFLSPGERAEIVIEMRADDAVRLQSFPADAAHRGRVDRDIAARFGFDDTLDVLTLRSGGVTASPALPSTLAAIAPLTPAATAPRRRFDLQWHMINRKQMDMNRIDFTAREGDTEVWTVRNVDNWPHNFHVHDVQFQVTSFNDAAPPPELRGWKDTVYLAPGDRATLVMRFEDYSDPLYSYMFHCHLLTHEDAGMMGQFLVTADGISPRTAAPSEPASHSNSN
ncbi:multicopper oxidase family protein [Tsukamurella strandjordii]|uniref:multicopper oxidase family protein n=1 Tax=Tsukamurella strandjordii TaxID=147577 RepID=UPI0031D53614